MGCEQRDLRVCRPEQDVQGGIHVRVLLVSPVVTPLGVTVNNVTRTDTKMSAGVQLLRGVGGIDERERRTSTPCDGDKSLFETRPLPRSNAIVLTTRKLASSSPDVQVLDDQVRVVVAQLMNRLELDRANALLVLVAGTVGLDPAEIVLSDGLGLALVMRRPFGVRRQGECSRVR